MARFLRFLLGFGVGFSYCQTVSEPTGGSAILKVGRLLDVRKGHLYPKRGVRIEHGRIWEVGLIGPIGRVDRRQFGCESDSGQVTTRKTADSLMLQ
jgi:hypothetical protein